MKTTFFNVTITIDADDPKAAYAKLCDILADADCDWITDTFCDGGGVRETSELFPADDPIVA